MEGRHVYETRLIDRLGLTPEVWSQITYERDRRRLTREARGGSRSWDGRQMVTFSNTRRRRKHGERRGINPTRRFYPRLLPEPPQ